MTTIEHLQSEFNKLSDIEKQAFLERISLQSSNQIEIAKVKVSLRDTHPVRCPHCQSEAIVANGRLKGVQRYKCKTCTKNFSENTGSSIANLKKAHLWSIYVNHMFAGHSIAKCAELTGISIQTSFDWRHKILSSLRSLSPEKFEGISESDDIFFNYSEKGAKKLSREPRKRGNDGIRQGISEDKVAVIATCDRSKHKDFQVAKRGRIRKKDIERILGAKLNEKTILCTDSHRSYTAFTKANNIKHEKINVNKGQYVKDKVYHVQHVNQATQDLRKWMRGFNGVATKYLQNYLSWYMVLDQIKDKTDKIKQFAIAALVSIDAWMIFKNIGLNHI
jgi:transposase-like protein